MSTLEQLISQAQGLANDHPCKSFGHNWKGIGGRKCPNSHETASCSQTVFECARCGDIDYGEKGGPGWLESEDCARACSGAELSGGIA